MRARNSRSRSGSGSDAGARSQPAVSLERALSKLGVASRPEARALVIAGRVRVGDRVVTDPARRVDPDHDVLRVDGRAVRRARAEHWLVHKPPGYVTTRRDPEGRPTVYALLPPGVPFVGPVGRLDLDSSGLLLLTNDTQLAAFLTAPDSHVEKMYEVELDAPIDAAQATRLEAGVVVLGRRTLPARVELVSPAPSRALRITLVEGRNRQVRRMLASLGREVVRLHRVRIGPLGIQGLGEGRARRLRPQEIEALAALRSGKRPRRSIGGPSNDRGASGGADRGGQRPRSRRSSAGRGSPGSSARARSQAARAPAVSPSAARHRP